MVTPNGKTSKRNIPHTDSCKFYLKGFDTHKSGCGQIKITNRPPQFGVFFDGTGNNEINDFAQWGDKEPTNITKLYLLYPQNPEWHISARYIEGVGTKAHEKDSDIDMAIAYTIGDKVRQALDRAQLFFRDYPNAPIGILDVFGFSRGAAAARHFVNEVQRLNKIDPKHFGGPQLQIRFLGLFDTVGSIGIPGDNSQTLYDGESFILDVNPNAVQHVFHLTARHEQRKYFPLSSILTAPGQSPAPHFEEVEIPGAHSDVGGGYGTKPDMVYYPEESFGWNMTGQRKQKLIDLKARYEKQYPDPGVNITMKVQDVEANAGMISLVYPEWRREIKPQLAFSALSKMYTKATEKGVPLEPLEMLLKKDGFTNRQTEEVYVLPSDLQDHLTRLDSNPHNTRIEDYIYEHYIHHSHQYRATPHPWAWTTINSNEATSNQNHPAPNGKREIFYNKISLGYSPADQWMRVHIRRPGIGIWERQ
jgi:uncharacterized protein (DUF2235 family)